MTPTRDQIRLDELYGPIAAEIRRASRACRRQAQRVSREGLDGGREMEALLANVARDLVLTGEMLRKDALRVICGDTRVRLPPRTEVALFARSEDAERIWAAGEARGETEVETVARLMAPHITASCRVTWSSPTGYEIFTARSAGPAGEVVELLASMLDSAGYTGPDLPVEIDGEPSEFVVNSGKGTGK